MRFLSDMPVLRGRLEILVSKFAFLTVAIHAHSLDVLVVFTGEADSAVVTIN